MRSARPRARIGRRLIPAALALLAPIGVGLADPAGAHAIGLGTAAAPSAGPTVASTCSQNVAPGQFHCFSLRRSDLRHPLAVTGSPHAGLGPADLKAAYRLPSASDGPTVAIIDAYDDPKAESDLAAYRSYYHLPPCTTANGCFRKLNQNGVTRPLPAADTGWAGEIVLDVQMVSATCPACHIMLVESSDASSGLFTAVATAVRLGAKFVSMSWGGAETGNESAWDSAFFRSTGVVYTAASGDSGFAGMTSYPASSARVVSVGGTTLRRAANARGWSETVWSGSGSGCSSNVTKPAWQSLIPADACTHRAVSDVAAVADPRTGVAVYQTYGAATAPGWAVYGGTSAAAPIIAAVYALGGTPGGSDAPASYPYAHRSALNDVTAGSTGSCSAALLCTAATGWDGPTGLGSPSGVAAFSAARTTPAHTLTLTNPGSLRTTAGMNRSVQLGATSSARSPISFRVTGLPAGLTASPAGLISGRALTAGRYPVSVSATDGTGAAARTDFGWTVAPPACTGQAITNSDFAEGGQSWSASNGVLRTGVNFAHSGQAVARLDGYGRRHVDVLQHAVLIPDGCQARLTYYYRVVSADLTNTRHDTLTLTADSRVLQTLDNRQRAGAYQRVALDLSAAAGRRVSLRWTGREDGSRATSFLIDDVSVTLS
jgi:hypothetical protein